MLRKLLGFFLQGPKSGTFSQGQRITVINEFVITATRSSVVKQNQEQQTCLSAYASSSLRSRMAKAQLSMS